ncbi:hypothetical protein EZS27_004216 [termite gut metagenome]|uniref:Uncharacterized protein n=1 Tax=termite gut metagenome TaxID=433724 RepID=A0A5J4SQH1_9ZZZZ
MSKIQHVDAKGSIGWNVIIERLTFGTNRNNNLKI